ncbi:U4/U5/U6 small nuclear ribonucleoprotein prp3 [Rhodosporidiobolus nylandii]
MSNRPGERKRANVFGEEDPVGGPSSPAKRAKANAPAAPSFKPVSISASLPPRPAAPGSSSNPAIDIAAKRAEIQAKLAAMKAAGGLPAAPPATGAARPPPPPPSAGLPARPGSALPAVPGLPTPNLDPELAKKIAEAKRKVAEMAARKQKEEQARANPYLSASFQGTKKDPALDPSVAARGGLAMAAHPLLMDTSAPSAQSKKDRYKPMAPKFSTTKANARMPAPSPRPATPVASTSDAAPDSLKETAFFDPRLAFGSAGVTGKSHMGKGHARSTFQFKTPGTFVKKGEAIRAEARMEDLKRRILESSQKAGVLSDLEETAKKVRRPEPPAIEWWDEEFLPEKDYASQSADFLDRSSLISHLVQHPISIPAPQDKIAVEPKELFLTKKELKKKRKMRRQAELQDKQDRQKMGLLPPDPPKVKISNMMRVLTQDAIADPTKVEAQVRREMVARERKHLKDNAARALTDEERRQKREDEYAKDEAKGIQAAAFKVRYLSDPSHKFKVKKNAIDMHLTGVICHNRNFCLVVVEGGAKSIKKYRQLMLNRIRWTEEAAPRNDADQPAVEMVDGIPRPTKPFNAPEEADDAPASLQDNYVREIWSGALREHLFGDMRHSNCPSDSHAREQLGKLGHLWDVAKAEGKDEVDV